MSFRKNFVLLASLIVSSSPAFSAGLGVEMINWYDVFLHTFGLGHRWVPVCGSCFVLAVLTIVGLRFQSSLRASNFDPVPKRSFSLLMFVEWVLEFIDKLVEDILPTKEQAAQFLPLLLTVFLFFFSCNISGLVPGFPPATESMSTNLVVGLTIFFIYNYQGVKENGKGYLAHFLGPVWWLAPLMFTIELISHLVRPVSLSLRLYGNIFGDHLVLSLFTGLTYVVVPAILLFLGLLVACIQSFVFTLLSGIYISLAVSHDH